MQPLIAACVAFVGTHFLLSHPLRAPLVARLGERGFLGVYSLVALLTFGWMIYAFWKAGHQPFLWPPTSHAMWNIATVAMWVGSVLFMGSLFGNPALPTLEGHEPGPREPKGVFAITRHPMMWGFAIWGGVHIAVLPTERSLVLSGTIIFLALAGAWAQDLKKARRYPQFWADWRTKTSYFPFVAQIRRRAPFTLGGWRPLLDGTVLWALGTWLHMPLGARIEAGIWRWTGPNLLAWIERLF